jgi:hypothetical protein
MASEPRAVPSGPGVTPEAPSLCERCGTAMREVHCKIICPCCGYTRDCSDP